ncbi:MAG TPA: DNA primase small subunit domain-containing protein [Candidatus Nanoarchaeia archaeon]|nr:DNA primase small subunit domain-containing protein [Candidatus Nanoarchaeia archaeon]
MLTKSTILKHYKRKEMQEAMVQQARNKEVGVRYGDSFGKRPDILSYPRDVLELALQNVTSFHASEELWSNPLSLSSSLSRKELDELRIGWDLVLDIDCPDWEFSKLTTHLFIKALTENGVKEISCKFSGNKGFHIGVPFEAFPKELGNKLTKERFPEAPKKISLYLLDFISKNYVQIEEDKIIFDRNYAFNLEKLKEKFGDKKFILKKCSYCKKEITSADEELSEFICPRCEQRTKSAQEYLICDKCRAHMVKIEKTTALCECGSNEYKSFFNPLSIIEVDTILISSRHLYRMPYSLHEKSALVSLPIDPEKVLDFKKAMAKPEAILTPSMPKFTFLDRKVSGESARGLLLKAIEFEVKMERELEMEQNSREEFKVESPITEEFFPPCISKILQGLEDGKKRAVFILMNFLGKIGWNKEEIKQFILKWNREKNREPLRDNYIFGQLSSFKPGEKLPPNCNNEAYYLGIGMCLPDGLCSRIKNPVNYTILRWKSHLRENEEEKDEDDDEKDNEDGPTKEQKNEY